MVICFLIYDSLVLPTDSSNVSCIQLYAYKRHRYISNSLEDFDNTGLLMENATPISNQWNGIREESQPLPWKQATA